MVKLSGCSLGHALGRWRTRELAAKGGGRNDEGEGQPDFIDLKSQIQTLNGKSPDE
jgi:hypothetical protein